MKHIPCSMLERKGKVKYIILDIVLFLVLSFAVFGACLAYFTSQDGSTVSAKTGVLNIKYNSPENVEINNLTVSVNGEADEQIDSASSRLLLPGDVINIKGNVINSNTENGTAIKSYCIVRLNAQVGNYSSSKYFDLDGNEIKINNGEARVGASELSPNTRKNISVPYTIPSQYLNVFGGKELVLQIDVLAQQFDYYSGTNMEASKQLMSNYLSIYSSSDTASTTLSGSGTSADPYLINSAGDMLYFANSFSSSDKYFKLNKDLNFSALSKWTPIGASLSTSFKGHFNGASHSISGLNFVSDISGNAIGLFGYVDGASVNDLYIVDAVCNITKSTNLYFGAICAYAKNATSIENCYVLRDENVLNSYFASSTDNNWVINLNITSGINYIGGIVGYMGSNSTDNSSIKNCFIGIDLNVNVSTTTRIGGVSGVLYNAVITNTTVVNNFTVKSNGTSAPNIGLLVGYNLNSYNLTKVASNMAIYGTYSIGFGSTTINSTNIIGNLENGTTSSVLGPCDYMITDGEWHTTGNPNVVA